MLKSLIVRIGVLTIALAAGENIADEFREAMRRMHVLVLAMILLAPVGLVAQLGLPKKVHKDEFNVVGIEARTSGERETSGEGIIGDLWQKFYQDRVLEKIPNKADQNIYVLYTNYSHDRMGEYTVIIGAKVKDKTQVPDGMVAKMVPAGQYAVLSSERGPAASVIPTAWQKVWALEDKDELGGKRAYKVDFEVYDSSNTDPNKTQADLFVGIKDPAGQK